MSTKTSLVPIPVAAVQTLTRSNPVEFALYLPNFADREPVLYREAGVGLSKPEFECLRDNGVSRLFLRAECLPECEKILEQKLIEILHSPDIPPQQKAECVQWAGTTIARDLICEPRPETLARTSSLLDAVIEGILADSAVTGSLLQMAAHHQTTASHLFAVSALGIMLGAEAYGADTSLLKQIGLAGILHDLGKRSIPPELLNKSGALTREEAQLLMQHPTESVRLVNDDPQADKAVRQMILQHHERIDGSGYPLKLSGSEMLPGSRVLAVVDAFHAIIGRRSYRAPLSASQANALLVREVGRQFDPGLFACWEALFQRSWRELPLHDKTRPDPEKNTPYGRLPLTAQQLQPIPRRLPRSKCHSRVRVGCIYAGRLAEVNQANDVFVATLCDISRAGSCLHTAHPMYRGEVVSLLLNVCGQKIWVRATVAWCRKQPGEQMYQTGLQFIRHISSDEANKKAEPEGVQHVDGLGISAA